MFGKEVKEKKEMLEEIKKAKGRSKKDLDKCNGYLLIFFDKNRGVGKSFHTEDINILSRIVLETENFLSNIREQMQMSEYKVNNKEEGVDYFG